MNQTMQGILWIVDDPLSAGVIVVAFAVQVGICILPRSGCTLEVGGGVVRCFGRVGWDVCPPSPPTDPQAG